MSMLEEDIQLERGKTESPDPLKETPEPPDRVFYATGVLLDAEDFNAEQLYHRGRLARALNYLHGSGTIAGLKVTYQPPKDSNSADDLNEEIMVDPGVAIDRLGRMIEVPRTACIRLNPWFKGEEAGGLRQSFYENVTIPAHKEKDKDNKDVSVAEHKVSGVVADVFIRFAACERGKTPAFANGPFDALDNAKPSRIRDGYKLKLFPRKKSDAKDAKNPLPLPENIWPSDKAELRQSIFSLWKQMTARDETNNNLEPLAEHLAGQDSSYVFLARVIFPTEDLTKLETDQRPKRKRGQKVEIINDIRPFVYSTGALARLAGL
jgi:hypothetical protein